MKPLLFLVAFGVGFAAWFKGNMTQQRSVELKCFSYFREKVCTGSLPCLAMVETSIFPTCFETSYRFGLLPSNGSVDMNELAGCLNSHLSERGIRIVVTVPSNYRDAAPFKTR